MGPCCRNFAGNFAANCKVDFNCWGFCFPAREWQSQSSRFATLAPCLSFITLKVLFPNSSKRIKLRFVEFSRAWINRTISIWVEEKTCVWEVSRDIRQEILSVKPIFANSAGTKLPICARKTIKPTLRLIFSFYLFQVDWFAGKIRTG